MKSTRLVWWACSKRSHRRSGSIENPRIVVSGRGAHGNTAPRERWTRPLRDSAVEWVSDRHNCPPTRFHPVYRIDSLITVAVSEWRSAGIIVVPCSHQVSEFVCEGEALNSAGLPNNCKSGGSIGENSASLAAVVALLDEQCGEISASLIPVLIYLAHPGEIFDNPVKRPTRF